MRERSQVRSVGGSWIPEKANIELTPPGMIIWTLLISVAVMQWAVYSIKRDDRQHALLAVGTTLVMGAMVLVQHGWQLSQMNLVADEGPTTAATLIYTIVGSYMVAFVIGMIFFDTYLDLSYSWDYDGVGLAGVTPGIMGFIAYG